MAEFNANEVKAPVYRYFTVDLMSNRILMEIPFQKVSYERALKAAGGFSGEIPVIANTRHLGLYENTMPGQTALYITRNGVCVWGGIIWDRSYGVKSKVLQVAASEFTSYFYHRLIWKTFNYQYGATVDVSAAAVDVAETTSRNVATNPRANQSVYNSSTGLTTPVNWSSIGTTGSGATFIQTYGQNYATPPLASIPFYSTANNIATYARLTFGTSAAAASGIRYTESISAGQQYNFSMYAYSSMVNDVQLRVTFANSSGATVGSISYSSVQSLSAAWQQLVVSGAVAPTGATRVYVDVYAPTGTAWSSGAFLAATAVRVAPTNVAANYDFFDGYFASEAYTTYNWDGIANASQSIRTIQTVNSDGTGNGTTTVTLENGSAKDVVVGAKVELDFYEPENFPYNGYYRVTKRDSPSSSTFEIDSAVTANVVSMGNPGYQGGATDYSRVFAVTDAPHGFSTGDTVKISNSTINDYNGSWTVTAVDGPTSKGFWFTLPSRAKGSTSTAWPRRSMTPMAAMAARNLPFGVSFENVTISVHTDTYDYIRGLVSSVWNDFSDIEFADEYLTPGTDVSFRITQYQLGGGYATITTSADHGLVVGQSVTISELDPPFNGTWVVAGIPTSTSFAFELSGTAALTNVTPLSIAITSRYVNNGIAYVTYPPNIKIVNKNKVVWDQIVVGDTINIPQSEDFDGLGDLFVGNHTVEYHPKPGVIGWSSASSVNSAPARPVTASITSSKNGSTYSFPTVAGYSLSKGVVNVDLGQKILTDSQWDTTPVVGSRVNVVLPYAMPVVQKSIDAANNIKSISTATPHNLSVGDKIVISGDADSYGFEQVQYKTNNTFTVTTTTPHNIRKGQYVTIKDGVDVYTNVRLLSVTNNVAKIVVNGGNHNITYPYWYTGTISSNVDNTATALAFSNFYSYFPAKSISVKNGVATVKTHSANTFLVNDTITISGLSEAASVVSKEIRDGIIILTTDNPHNFQVSDEITVTGLGSPYDTSSSRSTVVLSVTETRILYQYVDSKGNGKTSLNAAPTKADGTVKTSNSTLNGNFVVTSKPDTNTLTFSITANNVDTRSFATNTKVVVGGESILKYGAGQGYTLDANGNIVGTTTAYVANDAQRTLYVPLTVPVPNISSEINVGSSRDTAILRAQLQSTSPVSDDAAEFNYQYYDQSRSEGWKVVSSTTNTFTCEWYSYTQKNYPDQNVFWPTDPNASNTPPISKFTAATVKAGGGVVTAPSAVGGDFVVSEVVSDTRVNAVYKLSNSVYIKAQPPQSVLETGASTAAYFRMSTGNIAQRLSSNSITAAGVSGAVTGTGTISAIDTANNAVRITMDSSRTFGSVVAVTPNSIDATIPYARNGNQLHRDIPYQTVTTSNVFTKTPVATISTYGPFPGNAGLGMTFSTSQYSGVDVTPTAYRGFAMTNVGEALDAYSGTTNGFEYRIDAGYDADRDEFTRTFVLIPINFPDPPNAGEVSDPSRFGADKLVFEYPGSVIDVKLDESAENSATRFFAVGDADLGADTAEPYTAASSLDLLDAQSDRKWPLLDDHESVEGVSDKDILGTFAEQYLNEARPPEAEFTISVDGSLQPPVNTYLPGNWCSIIVNDDFIKDRLASKMEPRDTVLVRKIDSYKVNVPDGVTFPETVELTLIAEWDVDKKTT